MLRRLTGMSALLDSAYEATKYYSHRDSPPSEAIAAIAEACPNHPHSEYADAYECACRLKELALDLADKWWSHLVTEREAEERLKRSCPGFDAATYAKAWSQATNFIWR
jgi:hypothetical protein